MRAKRLLLPKRSNVATAETAYQRLRDLNAKWHFGNNYLLTVLLKNFDELVDPDALSAVMAAFIAECGHPKAGSMG